MNSLCGAKDIKIIGGGLMNALPGQMELATVIDHKPRLNTRPTHLGAILDDDPNGDYETPRLRPIRAKEIGITHDSIQAASGVRLAKMLSQYDDSPSSQLWGDIQRLAREILR